MRYKLINNSTDNELTKLNEFIFATDLVERTQYLLNHKDFLNSIIRFMNYLHDAVLPSNTRKDALADLVRSKCQLQKFLAHVESGNRIDLY